MHLFTNSDQRHARDEGAAEAGRRGGLLPTHHLLRDDEPPPLRRRDRPFEVASDPQALYCRHGDGRAARRRQRKEHCSREGSGSPNRLGWKACEETSSRLPVEQHRRDEASDTGNPGEAADGSWHFHTEK